MDKNDKGLMVFFSLIILYVGSGYFVGFFGQTLGMIAKIVLLSGFLWYFRSWFTFKPKFDFMAVVLGIIIAVLWVALDSLYPLLSPVVEVASFSIVDIILKLIIGVVFASIIEEFFTRFFLHRALASKQWLTTPLGQYSLFSFIITTLFFAFAHNRWLAGLITGAILNLFWYTRRDMNSIVLTHAIANLVLGILIIITGNYSFWS